MAATQARIQDFGLGGISCSSSNVSSTSKTATNPKVELVKNNDYILEEGELIEEDEQKGKEGEKEHCRVKTPPPPQPSKKKLKRRSAKKNLTTDFLIVLDD